MYIVKSSSKILGCIQDKGHANSFACALSWDYKITVTGPDNKSVTWQYGECNDKTINDTAEIWRKDARFC